MTPENPKDPQPRDLFAQKAGTSLYKHLDRFESGKDAPLASPGPEESVQEDRISVIVQFSGPLKALEEVGFRPSNQTLHIVSGSILPSQLLDLLSLPHVIRVEQPKKSKLDLDTSIPDIRADQVWTRSGDNFNGYTGAGVIIGIIDTGIDYLHQTFRKPDGSSRILCIWDQTLEAKPGSKEQVPGSIVDLALGDAVMGYGVEYKKEPDPADPGIPHIDGALSNEQTALSVVRHRDLARHGTHVAGIAAGNGSQNGNCHGAYHFIGVAPEADLIVVRKNGLTTTDRPDSALPGAPADTTADAVRYILDRAAGRPVVINMSFSSDIGPRDGSSQEVQRLDFILSNSNSGVSVVRSISNDGNMNRHAQGIVGAHKTPEGKQQIIFKVDRCTRTQLNLELYYAGTNLRARVKPPRRDWSDWIAYNHSTPAGDTSNKGGSARIFNYFSGKISLELEPRPSPRATNLGGRWTLEIENTDPAINSTPFHAWAETGISFKSHQSESSSLSVDASGVNIISVGAYATKGATDGELAEFSSRGPAFSNASTGITVPANGTLQVPLNLLPNTRFGVRLRFLSDGKNLDIRIQPPGGAMSTTVTPGEPPHDLLGVNNGGDVFIINGSGLIIVSLNPPDVPSPGNNNLSGDWLVELDNNTNAEILAWAETDSSNFSFINLIRAPNIRPHITAPGVAITSASTHERLDDCCCDCCRNYYLELTGTSMAAPHVTGAVALMLQKDPDLPYYRIRHYLKDTARDVIPGFLPPDNNWGWGKLDIKAAIDAVPAAVPFPIPAAPEAAPAAQPALVAATESPLRSVQDRFLSTDLGRELHAAFQKHFEEVRSLINTNKRMAVVWLRNQGPKLIDLAFDTAVRPSQPIPVRMGKESLLEKAEEILDGLTRYGSETLHHKIDRYRYVLSLIREGQSLDDLIDILQRQSEPPFQQQSA